VINDEETDTKDSSQGPNLKAYQPSAQETEQTKEEEIDE